VLCVGGGGNEIPARSSARLTCSADAPAALYDRMKNAKKAAQTTKSVKGPLSPVASRIEGTRRGTRRRDVQALPKPATQFKGKKKEKKGEKDAAGADLSPLPLRRIGYWPVREAETAHLCLHEGGREKKNALEGPEASHPCCPEQGNLDSQAQSWIWETKKECMLEKKRFSLIERGVT